MNGYLIDNGIFFASIYEGHTQHKASRMWLDDVKPVGWAISTETFLAAMRLLMNPAVMGPNPLNGAHAWDVVSMEIGGKHPAHKLYAKHLPDLDFFLRPRVTNKSWIYGWSNFPGNTDTNSPQETRLWPGITPMTVSC